MHHKIAFTSFATGREKPSRLESNISDPVGDLWQASATLFPQEKELFGGAFHFSCTRATDVIYKNRKESLTILDSV